jgi:hypothetical protein
VVSLASVENWEARSATDPVESALIHVKRSDSRKGSDMKSMAMTIVFAAEFSRARRFTIEGRTEMGHHPPKDRQHGCRLLVEPFEGDSRLCLEVLQQCDRHVGCRSRRRLLPMLHIRQAEENRAPDHPISRGRLTSKYQQPAEDSSSRPQFLGQGTQDLRGGWRGDVEVEQSDLLWRVEGLKPS